MPNPGPGRGTRASSDGRGPKRRSCPDERTRFIIAGEGERRWGGWRFEGARARTGRGRRGFKRGRHADLPVPRGPRVFRARLGVARRHRPVARALDGASRGALSGQAAALGVL